MYIDTTANDVSKLAEMHDVIITAKNAICIKHADCDLCPLGNRGVFNKQTCDELSKIARKLELLYGARIEKL